MIKEGNKKMEGRIVIQSKYDESNRKNYVIEN